MSASSTAHRPESSHRSTEPAGAITATGQHPAPVPPAGWHTSSPRTNRAPSGTSEGATPTQPTRHATATPPIDLATTPPNAPALPATSDSRDDVRAPVVLPHDGDHRDGHSRAPEWARTLTTLAVVVVALVAAIVSYEHMREVAALAGEGWRSWLLPLSVDGLIVAASMTMLVRRRRGQPAGWLAWSSLLLGIAASIAANVASADPGWMPRLVAAWSPLALLLAVELLMQQGRPPNRRPREHRRTRDSPGGSS